MSNGKFFAAALAAASLAVIILTRNNGEDFETFPISALVNPSIVVPEAAQIPSPDEDTFIRNAWQYVGAGFPYERVGSDMTFENGQVECARCLLPQETISHGRGNCVAKSSLLTSILRYRLPPDRVYMVIGDYYGGNGLTGDGDRGHAWVQVFRNGDWYLLEATSPPRGWLTVSSQSGLYVPFAHLNDQHFDCNSPTLCFSSSKGCIALEQALTEPCGYA